MPRTVRKRPMRTQSMIPGLVLFLVLCHGSILLAQSEVIMLDHQEMFEKKHYPPVPFPHELHMESIGCLDCHHDYQDGKNVLDESLLEEGNPSAQCVTCHRLEICCDVQKAYHGLCMGCHLRAAAKGNPSGPRMCAGCHPGPKKTP